MPKTQKSVIGNENVKVVFLTCIVEYSSPVEMFRQTLTSLGNSL